MKIDRLAFDVYSMKESNRAEQSAILVKLVKIDAGDPMLSYLWAKLDGGCWPIRAGTGQQGKQGY